MQVFVPRKRPAPDAGDPELRWMDFGPVRLAEMAFVLTAGWYAHPCLTQRRLQFHRTFPVQASQCSRARALLCALATHATQVYRSSMCRHF